jgi:radical SAM protein with 4Fe4S-binding SPASM domain
VGVHYFVLVAVGCGMEIADSELLDEQDTDEVLRAIKKTSQDFPLEVRPTCAPQYARFVKEGQYSGCIASSRVFFISAEGDLYPCGYLPVKAGSIREDSIENIWKHSPVFMNLRQNDLKGHCSLCSIKNRCKGCRARAYSKTGDYMSEDPTCITKKDTIAA